MNRGLDSVRRVMNFGLENGKTSMIVYLDELKALFDALDAATTVGVSGVELDVTVVERPADELGRMTPGHPNAGKGPTEAEADAWDAANPPKGNS